MTLRFDSFEYWKTTYNQMELPASTSEGVTAWLRHDYLAADLANQTLRITTQAQESLSIHVIGIPISGLSFDTLYHGDATDLFLHFVHGTTKQVVKVEPGQHIVSVTFDPPLDPFDVSVFAYSYTHAAEITADNFQIFAIPEPAFPLWMVAALVIFVCLRRLRTPPPGYP